jgi:disulfide bond formation protein DsbB
MSILKQLTKVIRIIFFIGTIDMLLIVFLPPSKNPVVNLTIAIFVWLIFLGIYEYYAYKAKKEMETRG